jgi:hypothetical protein
MNPINNFIITFVKDVCGKDITTSLSEKKTQQTLKKLVVNFNKGHKKDPNLPKRPLSSYMFFCNLNRDKTREKLGDDSTMISVTKELSKQWNLVKNNKSELPKYTKMAQQDIERHKAEMEIYIKENGSKPEVLKIMKKRMGPKYPKSAYLFFCDKYRPIIKKDNQKMSATEVTKELGKRWADMKNDKSKSKEMKTYQTKSQKDKERYMSEKNSTDVQVGQETEVIMVEEVDEPKPKSKRVKKTKKINI